MIDLTVCRVVRCVVFDQQRNESMKSFFCSVNSVLNFFKKFSKPCFPSIRNRSGHWPPRLAALPLQYRLPFRFCRCVCISRAQDYSKLFWALQMGAKKLSGGAPIRGTSPMARPPQLTARRPCPLGTSLRPYPCLNCAGRFSRNAFIPSFWSSVANNEWNTRRSNSSPSDKDDS